MWRDSRVCWTYCGDGPCLRWLLVGCIELFKHTTYLDKSKPGRHGELLGAVSHPRLLSKASGRGDSQAAVKEQVALGEEWWASAASDSGKAPARSYQIDQGLSAAARARPPVASPGCVTSRVNCLSWVWLLCCPVT